MNTRTLNTLSWTARFTLIMLLAGCAALQVDVDVYKGPLANEEEVQVRQFAALAVAAKPLLARLRNEAEMSAHPEMTPTQEALARTLQRNTDQLNAFIDGADWKSNAAQFVNGAMSLYEDIPVSAAGRILDGVAKLKSNLETMQLGAEDRTLAQSIRTASDPLLAEAYREFLEELVDANTFRDCKTGSFCLRKVDAWKKNCATPPVTRACMAGSDQNPTFNSTNAAFERLSDRSIVEQDARVLFGKGGDSQFVNRVTGIAQAYLDGRRAAHDVWLDTLNLMDTAKPNQRAVAAGLVAHWIQPRMLACIASAPSLDRLDNADQASLIRTRLTTALGQSTTWNRQQYQAASEALVKLLIDDAGRPSNASQSSPLVAYLRRADARWRTVDARGLPNCTLVDSKEFGLHIKSDASRRFGLARSITSTDGPESLQELIERTFGNLAGFNAAGFERARRTKGIETLTREYLESLTAHRHDPRDPDVQSALAELEEALLAFSERLLFVVNNEVLFESDVAGALKDDAHKSLRQQTAIMQTLGNTIALHANDLHRRHKHADRLKRDYAVESSASQLAFEVPAALVYDHLLTQVRLREAALATASSKGASAATTCTASAPASVAADDDAQSALADARARGRELGAVFRLLIGPDQVLPLVRGDTVNADLSVERKAIAAAVERLPDQVSAADVVAAWRRTMTALDEQTVDKTSHLRLRAAVRYLNGYERQWTDDFGSGADAKQLVVDRLLDRIGSHATKFKEELPKLVNAARSPGAEPPKAVKRAKAVQCVAPAPRRTLSPADAKQAQTSEQVLQQVRDKVVREWRQLQRMDGDAWWTALQRTVASIPAPSASPALVQQTLKLVKDIDPPALLSLDAVAERARQCEARVSPDAASACPTQLDVMDAVIAHLRQQQLQALANGQADRADHLRGAINEAFQQRQSLAYLRPASDYLRSAYASSATQAGSPRTDRNMLTEYLRAVVPLPAGSPEERQRDTQLEIDKLAWQNVNSVSLRGGGNTNYVLAKDDVGNWYVKSYSSDPEAIYKSAVGLALFNAGKNINTNLLRRYELARQADDRNLKDDERKSAREALDKLPSTAQTSTLLKLRDRYAVGYRDDTEKVASELLGWMSKSSEIASAAVVAELGKPEHLSTDAPKAPEAIAGIEQQVHQRELTSAQTKLEQAMALPTTDVSRPVKLEQALGDGLTAASRYVTTLEREIRVSDQVSTSPGDRSTFADAVRTALRAGAANAVASRLESLRRYEAAVFQLVEVAQEK